MRTYFWCLVVSLTLLVIISLAGCGLQWVPPGQTPPPGARPVADVVLDAVADADAAGWGDLATVLASLVGGGGVLAVGRKFLKNHRDRRDLRETNDRQTTALREIIAGVQEIINSSKDEDASAHKRSLSIHQGTETERLVAGVRIDNATD